MLLSREPHRLRGPVDHLEIIEGEPSPLPSQVTCAHIPRGELVQVSLREACQQLLIIARVPTFSVDFAKDPWPPLRMSALATGRLVAFSGRRSVLPGLSSTDELRTRVGVDEFGMALLERDSGVVRATLLPTCDGERAGNEVNPTLLLRGGLRGAAEEEGEEDVIRSACGASLCEDMRHHTCQVAFRERN